MERNISTLHRAGADLVISYASLGSNAIINYLQNTRVMMLAEGLDIIRIPVPRQLENRRLRDSGIRQKTGCSVIALEIDGKTQSNPEPDTILLPGTEMILIGTYDSERRLMEEFDIEFNTTA